MKILSLQRPLEFELGGPQIVLDSRYRGIVLPKGTFVLQLTTQPVPVVMCSYTWWTHLFLLSDGRLAVRLMQKANVTDGMKLLNNP